MKKHPFAIWYSNWCDKSHKRVKQKLANVAWYHSDVKLIGRLCRIINGRLVTIRYIYL